MKIALISDIHGNETALKKVLNDIKKSGVDEIYCLGDIATLGASPVSAMNTIRDLNCQCIMGNHDEFMIEPELVKSYISLPIIADTIEWCRNQLTADDMDFIKTFKKTIEITLNEDCKLLLFHGSPGSHMDDILSNTSPDDVDNMLDGHNADVMACGHTHIQMLRQHKGTLIANPGSVGFPFKEYGRDKPPTILSHAEYAVIESENGSININLHRVQFDTNALCNMIKECKSPLRDLLLMIYK